MFTFISYILPVWDKSTGCLCLLLILEDVRLLSQDLKMAAWRQRVPFINATPLINLSKSVPHPMPDSSGADAGTPVHTQTHTHTCVCTNTVSECWHSPDVGSSVPNESRAAGQQPEPLSPSNDMFTIILFWDSGDTRTCVHACTKTVHTHTYTQHASAFSKQGKWTNGKQRYHIGCKGIPTCGGTDERDETKTRKVWYSRK